ncbi:MAG: beta galactosidase jelly roll domain-containing protein [Bryobacteraceae bacterium]|nr:beta galactosidase jelly roll domain-containing protein [Bryobacteraceae bacterium]
MLTHTYRILMAIVCALAAPLLAQEDIVRVEQWRVQAGDDPRWAAPDFDDSRWEASSWPRRYSSSMEFFAGTRWYRATVPIPEGVHGQPLAIAIGSLDEAYEVFADGVSIGSHGSWEPAPVGKFPAFRWFPIPASAALGSTVHVAIRRWTGATPTTTRASLLPPEWRRTPPRWVGRM